MLRFFKHENNQPLTKSTNTLPAKVNSEATIHKVNNQLVGSFTIPEPTRSLLFVTDEPTSKIEHAGSFNLSINININAATGKPDVSVDQKGNGFFAEPSLIWTHLPVHPNNEHVTDAMYYPSYSAFYPKTRWEYLTWLQDITKETNLSYVFLYFYGLERHLLIGKYDEAVDEVLRLLKSHPQQSFRYYASGSLIAASIARDRLDIIQRAPFLLDVDIDEALALRIHKGMSLSPDEVMNLANAVGFMNKRYIKLHPDLFRAELQKLISGFEEKHGNLLSVFKLQDFKQRQTAIFANLSIPDRYRMVKMPVIRSDPRFQAGIKKLLEQAHAQVKVILAEQRTKGRRKPA